MFKGWIGELKTGFNMWAGKRQVRVKSRVRSENVEVRKFYESIDYKKQACH